MKNDEDEFDTGWRPAGEQITGRVQELGWTTAEFSRQSGVSDTKLREFMNGTITSEPRPATIRKLEVALGWPIGAIESIRATGSFEWTSSDHGRVLSKIHEPGQNPVARLDTPQDTAERALAVSLTGTETEDEKRQVLEALIVRAARELERLEASQPRHSDRP